jgi:Cu-processing system ATP-binding protein
VSKAYGGSRVLEQINLTVSAGERLVLVGHNGAGKTTLMKLLLGLARPSSGKVAVFGRNPFASRSAARRGALGYLPESIAFDEAMTGRELLKFYAGLKGVYGRGVNGNACDELLKRVGIADAADRRLGTWSKGMRQRLGLAQAMLGHPQLLLLDEPTSGLDPSLRSTFYDIINELNANGVSVLISSHALNEVEDHADRVAIMRHGRLLACGTLAQLSEQAALPVSMRIVCAPGEAQTVADRFAGRVDMMRVDDRTLSLSCSHADKMAVLRRITDLGDIVQDVDIHLPRLDEIYTHFITGDPGQ